MASYRYERDIKPEDLIQETPPPLTPAQQRANWWHYHWYYVVLIAAALLAVGDFVWNRVTEVQPDYTVAVVSRTDPDTAFLSQLETQLEALAGDVNGDGKVKVTVKGIWLALDFETQDAALQQLMQSSEDKLNSDFYLCERTLFIVDDPAAMEQRYGCFQTLDGTDPEDGDVLSVADFALPLQAPAPDVLLRRAGRLLAVAPARSVLAGVLMLAGIGGMILLFPVSVFWAVLVGFWPPGLAAMQTLFPVLRQEYGVEVRSIPRPTAPDKPLTAQEQKKRSRANWWYYNWGIVAVAAMVIVGVAYVAHGLLTTVDPDYTVAVVTAEALPDEAVQRLQTALADYAEDANGDGAVVVQVNNYTWSADAALTDMNGQMAGATQMNTDLANGESKIWILDDPEGFEQAYGALSEKLGAEWQTKLIPWRSQPALSGLELGSYNTAADGSQTVDIQSRFAGYSVAVFDASDALWQALNS